MSDTLNLVGGLSAEIERVGAKATRWKGYMRETPELAAGMRLGLAVMENRLAEARTALNSGDVLLMIPAYQNLKDYSDDD